MDIDNIHFLPYVAGIIDGEGYISIRSDNDGEVMIIRMRDCEVLQLIQNKFGGSLISVYDKKYNTYMYQFIIANKKANELFKQVYPYLILKKENVKLCFRLREIVEDFKSKKISKKTRKCNELRKKMKLLTQRNHPVISVSKSI